ncbi:hypothetical protein J437_LFUL007634 [Ladona fulva]|uniref:Apolipophorin-III n=1 Tax=Ladona fulva TaxID=123851 RepID=A0A8K0K6Z0_LADFU|nr:hypothetical protein J437_LFUL007634 [Ladona fulva]
MVSLWHNCPDTAMAFSAKFALALVVLCFTQVAMSAHVRRSAEESSSPLQELMENARNQLKTVTEEINKLVSSSNFEEIKATMEAKTKELEERAKSVMEELKRQYEVHGAELSERASAAFNEATQRLNASLENLRANAPGAMEEVSAFQQRFQDTFKNTAETLFEETGKLAKAAGEDAESVHKAFTELSRSAMQNTMEVMQKLHQEVQEAVKKATES